MSRHPPSTYLTSDELKQLRAARLPESSAGSGKCSQNIVEGTRTAEISGDIDLALYETRRRSFCA